MAAATVRAEATLVNVVLAMARHTGLRQLHYAGDIRFVTRITLEAGMRAEQRKGGLGLVIELPPIPAVGIVAVTAIFPEAAMVSVIVGMARVARRIGGREVVAEMTALTCHPAM